MTDRRFKSFLITNIPESDWKKFKRWTAIEDFGTLNAAFAHLIKTAGNNRLAFYSEAEGEHTT